MEITCREALNQALHEEMARDPAIFILGEDVGLYEGSFKVTRGLLAKFGHPDRRGRHRRYRLRGGDVRAATDRRVDDR